MTRKLIALVDGSTYTKSVCEHAAWIAGRTGSAVELMHVLGRRETPSAADLSGSIALGARSALLAELAAFDEERAKLMVRRGRAILDDAKTLLEDAGAAVSTHLRHGDLVEAILEREAEADIVIIGKRGEAADFAKGHLGSNLERVMRATSKPLFVASRAFHPIENVLIAYDGSASAMRALEYVACSPLYEGLKVKVVTVGTVTNAAMNALANAAAVLEASGITVETEILPGQPDEVLSKLVDEVPFQHLVMGASGHSRLRALFIGSTSLEMIRNCKVPILLVK